MEQQATLVMTAQALWHDHHRKDAHHTCDTCNWYEQEYWYDPLVEPDPEI